LIPPKEGLSLPFDSALSSTLSFTLRVYALYRELISNETALSKHDQERGLGGNLLYIGELDADGRALLIAANIGGAASLAATAVPNAQKQSIRDGVVDFLVSSLDEALRILKNEIRKRNTVAVCVAGSPAEIESEMLRRGVQPDLQRQRLIEKDWHSESQKEESGDSPSDSNRTQALISWTVLSAPARWLPKLDEVAINSVETDDWPARRWLRLAPRYLGRMSSGARLLLSDEMFASRFVEQVEKRVSDGEIGTEVEIQVRTQGHTRDYRFAPDRVARDI
jgi:urocanate hydratase